jgi:hypothetical protein
MYSIQSTCDWCNKVSFVKKHEYVDGKYNVACKECDDLATFDVREFNNAELREPTHSYRSLA